MAREQLRVTPDQVELAQAKVEADEAAGRKPDPFLMLVANATPRPPGSPSAAAGVAGGDADAEREAADAETRARVGANSLNFINRLRNAAVHSIPGTLHTEASPGLSRAQASPDRDALLTHMIMALTSDDPVVQRVGVAMFREISESEMADSLNFAAITKLLQEPSGLPHWFDLDEAGSLKP